MARRRRNYRKTPYRYTPARAQALKRAQAISARKRRNRNIRRAAVAAGVVTGVGAGAYLGYKHGGKGGSVASSVSGRFSAKNIQARQAALRAKFDPNTKERTRIQIAQAPYQSTAVPFGKGSQQPVSEKRPYNVDRFINRDILRGRKLKRGTAQRPKYINRQIQKHQENVGKLTGRTVDSSKIIKDMIADGTVRGRVTGKRTRSKATIAKKKRNRDANLKQKAFEQWLKDNPDA